MLASSNSLTFNVVNGESVRLKTSTSSVGSPDSDVRDIFTKSSSGSKLRVSTLYRFRVKLFNSENSVYNKSTSHPCYVAVVINTIKIPRNHLYINQDLLATELTNSDRLRFSVFWNWSAVTFVRHLICSKFSIEMTVVYGQTELCNFDFQHIVRGLGFL